MKRTFLATAALIGMTALPHVADAASYGRVITTVNVRSCADYSCPRVAVIPGGEPISVSSQVGDWYYVSYGPYVGYVAGAYVDLAMAPAPPPPPVYLETAPPPPPMYMDPMGPPPPPPVYGYWQKPRWDDRHHGWYDGRRWYRDGRWNEEPGGVYFGLSFGG